MSWTWSLFDLLPVILDQFHRYLDRKSFLISLYQLVVNLENALYLISDLYSIFWQSSFCLSARRYHSQFCIWLLEFQKIYIYCVKGWFKYFILWKQAFIILPNDTDSNRLFRYFNKCWWSFQLTKARKLFFFSIYWFIKIFGLQKWTGHREPLPTNSSSVRGS